jgi:hypothetical protein
VLQAIGAISSMVTVQSDIGGGAGDAEAITADHRLHGTCCRISKASRCRF